MGPLPLPEWLAEKGLCVLEASGRGAYPLLLAEKFRYTNAEYGANDEGTQDPFGRLADLQRLCYPDESLDLVIAGDVFEHVPDDLRAFREVFRALKPGGLLIFTVPYDPGRAETLIRVEVREGVERFLEPPEYHGGGGRGLAYRTYGRDLPDRPRQIGFSTGYLRLELPEIAVSGQEVWVCARGPALDLTRFQQRPSSPVAPLPPLLPFRLWVLAKYNLRAAARVASDLRARLSR